MYCTHCGARLDESAEFCANCGRATSASAETGAAATFDAYDGELEVPAFRSFLWQNIALTLFCCLPFGAAGIYHSARALVWKRRGDEARAFFCGRVAETLFWSGLLLGSLYVLFSLFQLAFDREFWRALAQVANERLTAK